MRKAPQPEPSRAALVGAAIARRPREFVGLMMATIATFWIFTNALFMQKGPHPAPIFAAPQPKVSVPIAPPRPQTAPQPAAGGWPAAEPTRGQAPVQQQAVRQVEPVRKNDQIAALLAPKPQLIAVQQALADFAYGPVAPTGVYDPQTRAAVERFQRARGLTADGQLGERTLRELSVVTGRSFE